MITQEQRRRYESGWLKRRKEKEANLKQKHKLALKKAKTIARLLKNKYGIQKVVLFGSLVNDKFWEHSDIDIAVYGMDVERYLDILWEVYQIALPFKIDMIPVEKATGKLVKKIEQEGEEL